MMKNVGFIGLGNMGMPMAKNMMAEGYVVTGFNRSKGKEQGFSEVGGKVGYSVAQLAETEDVICLCLPKPEDVERMVLGEDGILNHAKEGLYIVDFSTISPKLAEHLYQVCHQRNIHFVDAPVSGGTTGAEAGTLTVMVGGEKEVFSQLYSLFKSVGEQIFHTGAAGSGTKVKLLNQYMVGMHTLAVAEGVGLAEQSGVDPELVYEILSQSFAQSKLYDRHYPNFIAKDQFDGGFAIELLFKDLDLVREMAEESDTPLTIGRQVTSQFEQAAHSDLKKKDMSAMYKFINKQ
ncbi:NAD(P)-dependent oxidoreductase [Salsuginibacillus kocurii]|uniref:NAD(P)-dependent oxidoreductase n=1 Tax=Salsuginibacillus kocurii TaxID=427078 RepID=UPI000372DC60|nr:NAD(P)-dependent oxidoreductase [Salsuginibacillus kocurii]